MLIVLQKRIDDLRNILVGKLPSPQSGRTNYNRINL